MVVSLVAWQRRSNVRTGIRTMYIKNVARAKVSIEIMGVALVFSVTILVYDSCSASRDD